MLSSVRQSPRRPARGALVATAQVLGLGLVVSVGLAVGAPTSAAAQQCRVVEVDLTPAADDLQIVAWLEDQAGTYVDTVYITSSTGFYGLGNRPGILEFNSGPKWPYGRRETVFPVWAHRHGQSFPAVVFQNSNPTTDRDLSHPFDQSSLESHFCRPMKNTEPGWDTGTCASAAYTDKGKLSTELTSLYPPRSDLVGRRTDRDAAAIDMYRQLNPFDSVSRATPLADVAARLSWTIPPTVPVGDYVLWVEVSKEFDHNDDYGVADRPSPTGLSYGDYGEAYRGQPSIVYQVPIAVADVATSAQTAAATGYGDPDGLDGNVRVMDDTISTSTPGSGLSRLTLVTDASGAYRVKVSARPETDSVAPGTPAEPMITQNDDGQLTITFEAPGDDGLTGRVTSYDVRVRAGEPITEANFEDSTPVSVPLEPDDPGQLQTFTVTGLLPATQYYVAVRANDDCNNVGGLMVVAAKTTERQAGEVDACFVATAAYGSLMANQVTMLRHFRDSMLSSSVLGELAVTAYYTFGPTVAGVVGESELLRSTARAALDPVVARVGAMAK